MRGKLGWETYCAFQGKEQARQGKWVYDWQAGILLTSARAQGLPLGMIRTGGYWPGVEEPCESLIQEVVGGGIALHVEGWLHLKGVLIGELFAVSRNLLAGEAPDAEVSRLQKRRKYS